MDLAGDWILHVKKREKSHRKWRFPDLLDVWVNGYILRWTEITGKEGGYREKINQS